jgi:hypothetical protein
VYEDYESDERVLNDQTGHRNSETRRNAYQEREREEIRAKSAETRRRVRAAAFGRGITDKRDEDEEPAPASKGSVVSRSR